MDRDQLLDIASNPAASLQLSIHIMTGNRVKGARLKAARENEIKEDKARKAAVSADAETLSAVNSGQSSDQSVQLSDKIRC